MKIELMNYLTLIWVIWLQIFNNIFHNNHESTFILVQSLTYMHGMHDIINAKCKVMKTSYAWLQGCKGMLVTQKSHHNHFHTITFKTL